MERGAKLIIRRCVLQAAKRDDDGHVSGIIAQAWNGAAWRSMMARVHLAAQAFAQAPVVC